MTYLTQRKLRLSQYGPRSRKPSGLIVLHTAESVMDTVGPDTGAENVAAFIANRTSYGSYHDLVDSDSRVHLVPYHLSAWQDGTGTNSHALSISFACRTTDWSRMNTAKKLAFLRQGAAAFAAQQAYLRSQGYPMTPLRMVTREQSSAGVPGFIYHGHRDPGRRTDPGTLSPHLFPWSEWLAACRAAMANTPVPNVREANKMSASEVWNYDAGRAEKGVQPAWALLAQSRTAAQTSAANTATILALLKSGLKVDVDEKAIVEGLRPYLVEAVTSAQSHPFATADEIVDALLARLS